MSIVKITICGAPYTDWSSKVPTFSSTAPGRPGERARMCVPQVPRTLTGKKLEVPIKKLLLGHPLEMVVARDAVADPSSLDWYVEFANRRLAAAGGGG